MNHDLYRKVTAAHAAAEMAAGLLADARVEAATDNKPMCGRVATRAAGMLREALHLIEARAIDSPAGDSPAGDTPARETLAPAAALRAAAGTVA